MIYIGIDNGVSGGIALLTHDGDVGALMVVPTQRARKGNEIDIISVYEAIKQWTEDSPQECRVLIEEPGGSKSASAARSMEGSFHSMRAVVEILRLRWHRITPREWQKVLLPNAASGHTKPRALELSKRLWPHISFLASERCYVPHDGLIDAALIAEYGRQKNL